ncbi:vWA domain-containing protein [Actinomadura formosensis]|uniref:vWA domain-containing protein n=1 Tax=Actinomadura formosensis TaxID=60706 RepID=UPI003D919423
MNDERMSERKDVEEGQIVMPFYLICDVSYSMTNDMPALNDGVKRLRRAIVAESVVDDVAQICVMTFSNDAKVVVPLSQMSETAIPELAVEGGTNYGSAFRELARVIEDDRAKLKAQGYRVFRPCAFFLTDGEPLDRDWYQTFSSALHYSPKTGAGMKAHPIFVPFGFRDAPEDVLRKLAYPPEKGKWYQARTSGVEEALKGILDVIMKTVITSGMSAQTNKPAVTQQDPAPGSGITHGDAEYDPEWI